MYSGTTLRHKSGNLFGVHQRINRVARRIVRLETETFFPDIKTIQHFEGKNGPDGIKSKRPGVDEPRHFINPMLPTDSPIITDIRNHSHNLVTALKKQDNVKAAFEAAWLSHAITDGLTPAHHFPYEDMLEDLRGEKKETRDTIKRKLMISGDTKRKSFLHNWQVWGAKGLMTSHVLFELGVASTTVTVRTRTIAITESEKKRLIHEGYEALFCESLAAIHQLHMYETFCKKGWTQSLARQTKNILLPTIMHSVALAWYDATYRSATPEKTR